MKYWFDTEFLERGHEHPIELISIGIIAEDGREYYAQVIQDEGFDARLTPWLRENVLPHLTDRDWKTRQEIAGDIHRFCNPDRYGKPEFWAYYADYDWVVLCQLFGRMIDLPDGWPMYCRDLKQWADMLGGIYFPQQGTDEHHALADARWTRQSWELLAYRSTTP